MKILCTPLTERTLFACFGEEKVQSSTKYIYLLRTKMIFINPRLHVSYMASPALQFLFFPKSCITRFQSFLYKYCNYEMNILSSTI